MNPNEPIVEESVDIRRPSELQPWTDELENYIKKILKESKESSEWHKIKGIKCKTLRHIWGLPSVVLPIAVAAAENAGFENKIFIQGCLALSTISAAVDHLFNFGKRSEVHFQAMSKFKIIGFNSLHQISKLLPFAKNCLSFFCKVEAFSKSILFSVW